MRNGIPWKDIKRLYETPPGMRAAELAERYNVTPQGINRRARTEGWIPGFADGNERAKIGRRRASETTAETGNESETNGKPETSIAGQIADEAKLWITAAKQCPIVGSPGKGAAVRTAENIADICARIARGVPIRLAAESVGISRQALDDWRRRDPDLEALIGRARSSALAESVERIVEAGKRGDWRADAYVLERAPETRDEYGQLVGKGGGGINVVINMDRTQGIAGAVTIEGESLDQVRDGSG